jgi:hypothetical protein
VAGSPRWRGGEAEQGSPPAAAGKSYEQGRPSLLAGPVASPTAGRELLRAIELSASALLYLGEDG